MNNPTGQQEQRDSDGVKPDVQPPEPTGAAEIGSVPETISEPATVQSQVADGETLEIETEVPARERLTWICPACEGIGDTRPGNCRQCGLALEPSELRDQRSSESSEDRSIRWRLLLGLLLTLPLLASSVDVAGGGHSFILNHLERHWFLSFQAGLATVVVFLCGQPILLRAWRSLRTFRPNVFSLTGLSILSAYLFSMVALFYAWQGIPLLGDSAEASVRVAPVVKDGLAAIAPASGEMVETFFESASIIVVMTLVGQLLELRARSRTETRIRKLMHLLPDSATVVLPNGEQHELSLSEVRPGDRIRVAQGGVIPVDGVIIEGKSTVDESLLTGEPMRVARETGMWVSAGTENGLGVLLVEAMRVREASALGRVINLVDIALTKRNPVDRTVNKLIHYLIPFVIVASITTIAAWLLFGPPGSATRGVACAVGVFVVSCPVALGLATPVAVAVGMSRASRYGIFFRDGAVMERMAEVDAIIFDKTGTLTEGNMKLVSAGPNVGVSPEELLLLAASVERGNDHPIGLAIVWHAVRHGIQMARAESVESIPGKGVTGLVEGSRITVGTSIFLKENGCHREMMISEATSHRASGKTVIFVGRDTACLGLIVFEDAIRWNARDTVSMLKYTNARLVMVTGDHSDSARGVAMQTGIEEVVSEALPVEKFASVQRLKSDGHRVAMCGDGINDAPALAAADVGIAMGTGSPAAIAVAGMTIAKSDLRSVYEARELSRETLQTIRQNLWIAFAFTAILVPLAAGVLIPFGGGLVSPVWGSLAMAVSSLCIVINPFRRKWKESVKPLDRAN